MQAGAMRKRLVIESSTAPVSDGAGGAVAPTGGWTPVATVWASVSQASGRDLMQAEQHGERATHTIEIRYRQYLDDTYRLREGARIFRIISIADPEERHRTLVITVDEVKGASQ